MNDHAALLQVKLFPKPECSCIERKNCCHILAVHFYNGEDSSKFYKTPNLSKLTRNKNHGITGRKRTGHKADSDPKPSKKNASKAAVEKNGEQSDVKENINQEPSTIKNMLTSLVLYEQRETADITLER